MGSGFGTWPGPVAAVGTNGRLWACGSCELLFQSQDPAESGVAACPRCDAALTRRKANSLSRTFGATVSVLHISSATPSQRAERRP